MSKSVSILVFFLSFSLTLSAQTKSLYFKNTNEIKLLQEKIKKSKNDTNKVNLFISLAKKYRESDLDSSLITLKIAKDLSSRLGYYKGLISSSTMLSNGFNAMGNFNSQLLELLDWLKLAESENDVNELFFVYYQLSEYYLKLHDNPNALAYSMKAIQLSNQTKEITESDHLMDIWINFSIIYTEDELFDSAMIYINKLGKLAMKDSSASHPILYRYNYLLANFYHKNKNYDLALLNYKYCYNIYPYGDATLGIAVVFFETNKYDSAVYYAKQSYENKNIENIVNGFTKNPIEIINPLQLIYRAYSKLKNIDSAYKYQSLYLEAKEKINNDLSIRNIQNISIDEKLRQEEIKLKEAQEEEERKRNLALAIIGFFIPTFASAVFYLSRKKKKNTRVITLMGIASLLMFFEFISLLIHPYIERITHHNAVLMYLTLLLIAAVLVPIHHKLEGWVKEKI